VAPVEKFPFDEFLSIRRAGDARAPEPSTASGRPWFRSTTSRQHRPYPNSDQLKICVRSRNGAIAGSLPDTPVMRKRLAEYLGGIERGRRFGRQAPDNFCRHPASRRVWHSASRREGPLAVPGAPSANGIARQVVILGGIVSAIVQLVSGLTRAG